MNGNGLDERKFMPDGTPVHQKRFFTKNANDAETYLRQTFPVFYQKIKMYKGYGSPFGLGDLVDDKLIPMAQVVLHNYPNIDKILRNHLINFVKG